ncbi:MAG: shikimate kinase [Phycisphaerales bacterium]|nr:shikimate kinase [Phycisphaerales bacterium]
MLILIGLRGSGKTTVGRLVAQSLGQPGSFVDLDDLVAEAGAALVGRPTTVGEVLSTQGQLKFRALEYATLRLACAHRPAVLSLGGGTPTDPRSNAYLRERVADADHPATIVYLRATPSTLARRLAGTDLSKRPSLTGRGVLEEIETLFQQRDEPYLALAARTVDVDLLTPEQIARAVLGTGGGSAEALTPPAEAPP